MADVLVHASLDNHKERSIVQQYCNTAWSLAVLGVLRCEVFDALLSQLPPPNPLVPRAKHPGNAEKVLKPHLGQLYQSLYCLEPSSNAPPEQHKAWAEFGKTTSAYGPCPPPEHQTDFPGNNTLCLALQNLGLQFQAPVVLHLYWAEAVLQLSNSTARPIIIAAGATDYLKNRGNR